jgi:hypothetical protein
VRDLPGGGRISDHEVPCMSKLEARHWPIWSVLWLPDVNNPPPRILLSRLCTSNNRSSCLPRHICKSGSIGRQLPIEMISNINFSQRWVEVYYDRPAFRTSRDQHWEKCLDHLGRPGDRQRRSQRRKQHVTGSGYHHRESCDHRRRLLHLPRGKVGCEMYDRARAVWSNMTSSQIRGLSLQQAVLFRRNQPPERKP